jgi:siderophore synthetase component
VSSREIDNATLAGARAAILARLWGAMSREPIVGLRRRRSTTDTLSVWFDTGAVLTGALSAARLFGSGAGSLSLTLTAGGITREVDDPGELVRALGPALGRHAARLAAELDNSVANLALARAARPPADGGAPLLARAANTADPLVHLEQSVVDGHPLHPCTRTRTGLSQAQVLAYAPEHRPTVRLREVEVAPQRWYGLACAPRLLLHPYQHELARQEHPWLAEVSREVDAYPLMSLRTLAIAGDPAHHVKTAVDAQMTSAVRTVSPASIHNGLALSGLLRQLADRVEGLEILAETGGGAVVVDGEPDRRLAVVHRAVPSLGPGEIALPLAALSAPTPATGAPLLDELMDTGYGGDPLSFLDAFAGVLLRPVFTLLRLGVALEAHGQNSLVVVRDGRVSRLWYRDFGGVRVSPGRLRRAGIEVPALQGDIATDDPEVLRTKVMASAVSTVLGETVAVLARHGLDEEKAWHRIAAVGRTLRGPDVEALFAGTLPLKAMTTMRLSERPLADQWCDLPNPMAGLR